MRLATASYSAWRPWLGQPVVTSLTTPKWMADAATWPVAHVLTPRWSYLNADPPEFERAYLAQLNRFGPAKIARCLHAIARQAGAEQLVLLCWEHDWNDCHRHQLASWLLETTGELIQEVGGPVPALSEGGR